MEKENEFILLKSLYTLIQDNPDASQRDISKAIHMSLGMTNSLLKRFAEKGWLYMRKISPKNVQYVLTPAGVNEVARKTYTYLKRTMKNVVSYKDTIVNIARSARKRGCTSVILIGSSDFDFIIDYACQVNSMTFIRTERQSDIAEQHNSLVFISEIDAPVFESGESNIVAVSLMDIITEKPVVLYPEEGEYVQ